jgi:hypothetical protein
VGRGQVLGASDRTASYPASAAYTPADLAANVLEALGVGAAGEVRDATGRLLPMNTGTPIRWD